ncbi:PIG-L family deacetylase [Curtobacterium flaccumfaciens]|nr:PIG-L family deacetylase [Curtobacterium flaccumfaciens]
MRPRALTAAPDASSPSSPTRTTTCCSPVPSCVPSIDAGKCVRSVIVTAGDAGNPAWYWQGREDGLMASYADIGGVDPDWVTGTLVVDGRSLRTETLSTDPRLSLVFMELPDGNVDGSGFAADGSQSLQKLYQGDVPSMHTVTGALHAATYTLSDLRATLLGVVEDYAPSAIHTLDHAGHYGDGDHSDHHTVAYLTDTAQQQYQAAHSFTGYLGTRSPTGRRTSRPRRPSRRARRSSRTPPTTGRPAPRPPRAPPVRRARG